MLTARVQTEVELSLGKDGAKQQVSWCEVLTRAPAARLMCAVVANVQLPCRYQHCGPTSSERPLRRQQHPEAWIDSVNVAVPQDLGLFRENKIARSFKSVKYELVL